MMTPVFESLPASAEHRVGPDDASSSFGYYGVTPESPDGSTIAYVRFAKAPTQADLVQQAELWLCDRDGTHHRKMTTVGACEPHNGACQRWVALDRILIQNGDLTGGTGGELRVYKIPEGELAFEPVRGSLLGPTQHGSRVLFAVWPRHEAFCGHPPGAYELDTQSGEVSQVFSIKKFRELAAAIPASICGQHPMRAESAWALVHLKYSPNGRMIALRPDILDAKVDLLAFYDRDKEAFIWFEDYRPNHFFWFDEGSVAGHDVNRARSPYRRLRRFSLRGALLEDIGPSGIHGMHSPDFSAFTTDLICREQSGIFYFRRGAADPLLVSASDPAFMHLVREERFHQNPTFSADGKRVYYNKPISNTLSGTFYYDLAEAGL